MQVSILLAGQAEAKAIWKRIKKRPIISTKLVSKGKHEVPRQDYSDAVFQPWYKENGSCSTYFKCVWVWLMPPTQPLVHYYLQDLVIPVHWAALLTTHFYLFFYFFSNYFLWLLSRVSITIWATVKSVVLPMIVLITLKVLKKYLYLS